MILSVSRTSYRQIERMALSHIAIAALIVNQHCLKKNVSFRKQNFIFVKVDERWNKRCSQLLKCIMLRVKPYAIKRKALSLGQ